MRVFLSGATGFLGSYILRELLARGHHVAVLLRKNTNSWRIQDVLPDCNIIAGDLNQSTDWKDQFIAFKPEAVIHTAWQGVENKEHNTAAQLNNFMDTKHLIELMITANCRSFIGTGSQAEYGIHNVSLDELAETRPISYYGAAKLATYHWARVQCLVANIRFAWLRVFTVYGPDDNPHWLIPYLIRTLRAGVSPELTPCEQRMGFLFVKDAAMAFADVLESPNAEDVFNLGSTEVVPLLQLATTLRNLIAPELELGIGKKPYSKNQIMRLEANIHKLNDRVGWRPLTRLKDGLIQTINAAFKTI